MKKNSFIRILCLAAALLLTASVLSSCKKGGIAARQFDESRLAEYAPAEYKIELPSSIYKDIDDIDLTKFKIVSKKDNVMSNGDGTEKILTESVYVNEDSRITVDINTEKDGKFSYGTVSYMDENGRITATSQYSNMYKELDSVIFDRVYEDNSSWTRDSYYTAYFDDGSYKHAVRTYMENKVENGVSTPVYTVSGAYTAEGKLVAVNVSVTGETELKYYDAGYKPVSKSIYSVIVASSQYSDYLLKDDFVAGYAPAELSVTLPDGVPKDFSELKKTDDYVLTDTKANYYGDDLKDDYGNSFNTTTVFYKSEKSGYTMDMTTIDGSSEDGADYLFTSHIKCENPKFEVAYRENGVLDFYIDYSNNSKYSVFYTSDFNVSYYGMSYSVFCNNSSDATANIYSEYTPENKLLRYCIEYSFKLTVFFDAQGNMIEDDDYDLLNPSAGNK